jgi:hypothetical protein
MNEPHIVINGIKLTDQQAMAVRVAVSSFRGEMTGPNPLGNDAHGIFMAKMYNDRLREVELFLVRETHDQWLARTSADVRAEIGGYK